MIVIPAMDLRRGEVVRLTRGDYEQETRYAADPLEQTAQFRKDGARRVHVVDLDAAKDGKPTCSELILKLLRAHPGTLQVGGGIREVLQAQNLLSAGALRVVVGTRACRDKGFLKELLAEFGNRVIVSVDVRDGRVASDGWTQTSEVETEEMTERILEFGGVEILYTDITKDGTLAGAPVELVRRLCRAYPEAAWIASGGVGNLDDLRALAGLSAANLLGCVVGKALYEKKFTLPEALHAVSRAASRNA